MKLQSSKIAILFLVPLVFLLLPPRPACAQKQCKVVVIENKNPKDNLFVFDAQLEFVLKGGYAVGGKIKNLTEMRDMVQTKFAEGDCDCIKELYIVGHGRSGLISVGDGQSTGANNQYIDGNKAQWQGPLNDIRILLCDPAPQVYLIGCKTGACNDGSGKLYELAQFLNATVTAPVDVIYGGKIFDYLTNHKDRLQTATPTSKPAHKATNKGQRAPVRRSRAGTEYHCACNGLTYPGVQDCVNTCPASLSCFTGICDGVHVNTVLEKYSGGPLLTAGMSGDWNDGGVAAPSLLKDQSLYKMWFTGWNTAEEYQIGFAASVNGLEGWNFFPHVYGPVLTKGAPGSWEDWGVYNPNVILDGGVYKMWYQGYSDMSRIGYATSTDGFSWNKHPANPVLDLGPGQEWDWHGVGHPFVIKDGATYKMWYEGYDGWYWRIGLATSADGITWTRHPENPVLSEGDYGTWEEYGVSTASVIRDGDTYHMLYRGSDSAGITRIGYARSNDGVHWTKAATNPYLGPGVGEEWDNVSVSHPYLYKDANEGVYKVFYRGAAEASWSIGYSTATDLFGPITPGFLRLYLPLIRKGL